MSHVCGFEDLILLMCQYHPKPIYRDLMHHYQSLNGIFSRNRKTHPKTHLDSQGIPITKTVLKKKNKVGRLILLDFRTYCKATEIKTV